MGNAGGGGGGGGNVEYKLVDGKLKKHVDGVAQG